MKRTSIILLAVAGLTLVACSSPKVGVNNTATTGAGSQTTGPSKTTTPTAPATGTVSPLLTGTAHPTIPALVPGKVAIIETGSASGTVKATVPVVVGNGTNGTISHIEVAGPAVDFDRQGRRFGRQSRIRARQCRSGTGGVRVCLLLRFGSGWGDLPVQGDLPGRS